MFRKERLLEMIEDLVSIPSITESKNESLPGIWIKERLEKLPYFIERKDHLIWVETPLEGAHEKLHSLVVRVDASIPTNRTVLFVGHYDVVDASAYGEIARDAFNVKKITKLLNKNNSQ